MYKIALPLQYEFNGQMKTQTLETKVVPSKDEVTETPEEKMRREYMEILNIGLKIENGEKLSDKEKKVYDEVGKYYNVFVMGREFNVQDDYSTWVGGWSNVRSIYDYKRKVWRTGTKNLVMSKNWNELEALMEKQNYQDVQKVEYN